MGARIAADPVENVLGHRGIPDQVGFPQDLQVTRDRGLGEIQHGLKIGDEEGGGRQTVEDPQARRLGEREQQVRRRVVRHTLEYMWVGIYMSRRMWKGCLPARSFGSIYLPELMTETIRIFINTSVLDVPVGSDVAGAVRQFDPALAERVVAGSAAVTDARGIRLEPGVKLAAGAILRVVVSARRAAADASQDVDG